VTRLDRLVTAFRRWVEDRLPWYDRDAEQGKDRRTEAIRQRSIRARIQVERQLDSYRRVRIGR
jgi:hypothetical protein